MEDDQEWQECFLWAILFGKNRRRVLKDIAHKAREEIKESCRKEEPVGEEN